jgi:hypothetical protein
MIAATGTVIEARFRLHNNRHHAVAQPTSRTPRPGNAAFAKQASNRSPQKAAGSNPAGGTEKFAAHMAFMRDIETHVPSTCHPLGTIVGSPMRLGGNISVWGGHVAVIVETLTMAWHGAAGNRTHYRNRADLRKRRN